MTITTITPLDKRRCKVSLEEGFALVLYKGEMKRYQIEEGCILTEDTYKEIVETILFKRARERVLYLLKGSDKTEKELRKKLEDGFYPKEAIEFAVNFVKGYHYIDDENYTKRYVEGYSLKKSRRQISYDLQQKGIAADMIREALNDCPAEEEDQIRNYLKKKKFQPDSVSVKDRQKLAAALGRKGFRYETISRVMGEAEYTD